MLETGERSSTFGKIGGRWQECSSEAAIVQLQFSRKNLLDELLLLLLLLELWFLSRLHAIQQRYRLGHIGIGIAGYSWRILRDERLDAFYSQPVCGVVYTRLHGDLFLPQDAVKVDFFVFDKVDRAGRGHIGERWCSAERHWIVRAVSVERLDVEYAKRLFDVRGGHGRTAAMAHEARSFLESVRDAQPTSRGAADLDDLV